MNKKGELRRGGMPLGWRKENPLQREVRTLREHGVDETKKKLDAIK